MNRKEIDLLLSRIEGLKSKGGKTKRVNMWSA